MKQPIINSFFVREQSFASDYLLCLSDCPVCFTIFYVRLCPLCLVCVTVSCSSCLRDCHVCVIVCLVCFLLSFLFACLSVCPSVRLFSCLYVCSFSFLPVFLSNFLSTFLSSRLSVCLYTHYSGVSLSLCVHLSVILIFSVCFSLSLSVCMSDSLCVFILFISLSSVYLNVFFPIQSTCLLCLWKLHILIFYKNHRNKNYYFGRL
jgi:hypothetical protein